ncbi:MAG: hypothetical protein EOM59_05060 [Clostridia bacterium]|nr:hypothetical protein [Clostridia bacterium]
MDNLMYLLILCVCILSINFFIEKTRTKAQFEKHNKLYEENNVVLSNLATLVAKEGENFSEKLKRVSSDTEEAGNELKNLISSTQSEIDKRQNEIEISLRKYIEDIVNNSSSDLNAKLLSMATILEKINTENKELKRKIEFFSEIESDSKQLNETVDTDAREALIQKALEEMSKPRDYSEKGKIETKKIDVAFTDNEKFSEEKLVEPFSPKDSITEVNREHFILVPEIFDEEQKKAFLMMEYSHENIFITGKAGTGKSFLLELFERTTQKKTIKLAPTGIAALNIGGVTLHSTFGFYNLESLNVEDISTSTLRIKSEKRMILKTVDAIVIDEISMVRADVFEKIDRILKIINENNNPFGGKQLLIFGDLFQLPPITKSQENKYLTDRYGGIYFFHSDVYKKGNFNFIELALNHRQKGDSLFFEILNRIREGKSTSEDIDTLNNRVVKDDEDLRRVLTLFPKKADAEMLNKEELSKIEAKEYSYDAKILFNKKTQQTPNLDSIFPITNVLKLKRGALIMLVANDPGKRWVNGTLGIVSSLNESGINVSIDGRKYDVAPITFTEQEAVYINGRIGYEDVLRVEQFPLILAYAITIHKSQGMTYKKVACDLSACFSPGQAYVALSRCSTLEGLYLLDRVTDNIAKVDNVVKEFYLKQFELNDDNDKPGV